MLALENPHCGVSGVPFMNKTTGADATALSIAALTWSERNRAWKGVMKRSGAEGRVAGVLARVAARNAWFQRLVYAHEQGEWSYYRGNYTS
jgi:hypothetical protein